LIGFLAAARNESVRYYFDSNIFIYAFECETDLGHAARRAFGLVEDGKATAVTSLLTLGEVLPGPLRQGNEKLEQSYELVFAGRVGFEIIPISEPLLRAAARLVANASLHLPDALHVASAIQANCDRFVTEDTGIKTLGELPIMRLADPAFT
jgi:predicted nucleic acid-binding protein